MPSVVVRFRVVEIPIGMAKRIHSVASKIPTGIERIEDFARRPKRPAWKIKVTFFPRAGKSHFTVIPHRPENMGQSSWTGGYRTGALPRIGVFLGSGIFLVTGALLRIRVLLRAGIFLVA